MLKEETPGRTQRAGGHSHNANTSNLADLQAMSRMAIK
jgi:hypothetical protein